MFGGRGAVACMYQLSACSIFNRLVPVLSVLCAVLLLLLMKMLKRI